MLSTEAEWEDFAAALQRAHQGQEPRGTTPRNEIILLA